MGRDINHVFESFEFFFVLNFKNVFGFHSLI
jgi:hypothetical protein